MKQTERKPFVEVYVKWHFKRSLSEDKQNCYDKQNWNYLPIWLLMQAVCPYLTKFWKTHLCFEVAVFVRMHKTLSENLPENQEYTSLVI